MLGKQGDVAWIKPLGFVEVHLAPIPLSLASGNSSQRRGDLIAVGQELARLLEVTHRGIVIL